MMAVASIYFIGMAVFYVQMRQSVALQTPNFPPNNAYVAEDGATFYVAEDGVTFYAQES